MPLPKITENQYGLFSLYRPDGLFEYTVHEAARAGNFLFLRSGEPGTYAFICVKLLGDLHGQSWRSFTARTNTPRGRTKVKDDPLVAKAWAIPRSNWRVIPGARLAAHMDHRITTPWSRGDALWITDAAPYYNRYVLFGQSFTVPFRVRPVDKIPDEHVFALREFLRDRPNTELPWDGAQEFARILFGEDNSRANGWSLLVKLAVVEGPGLWRR